MDLGLKGLRALVTGASRGLGFATAVELAREGALVMINSRDKKRLQEASFRISSETGVKVGTIAGDVGRADAVQEIVETAAQRLGGIDLLFTNSGGPPQGFFSAFDDQAWFQAFELSFMSHVRLIRSSIPYLKQSKASSVLTVTSLSVKQPIPDLILSNSIRSATIGLTKSLALEMGSEGIRFNSILPAWTETERVQELMASRAQMRGTKIEEEIIKQSSASALGRMGQPQEFARAAVFLLSPAASFLTGLMLSVDGGMYKGVY